RSWKPGSHRGAGEEAGDEYRSGVDRSVGEWDVPRVLAGSAADRGRGHGRAYFAAPAGGGALLALVASLPEVAGGAGLGRAARPPRAAGTGSGPPGGRRAATAGPAGQVGAENILRDGVPRCPAARAGVPGCSRGRRRGDAGRAAGPRVDDRAVGAL